ncbi:MAG: IclR family transcriptional regulator [Armatimonadota bacterium]|nr:IclR family transcriptional regulator [Armatimonadota bacterium]
MSDARASAAVRSVERALDVLRCFDFDAPTLGVSQIARRLHLAKSTVHRLLTTLERRGFVRQDAATGTYQPGLELFRLGRVVQNGMELRAQALPIMRRLQLACGETVNLNIVVGRARVCIEKVESRHDVRHFVELGKPLPLYVGASGKVLLAHLPPAEVAAVLQEARREGRVDNAYLAALPQQLAAIRRRGYAAGASERVQGAFSVSAPVRDHTGAVIAGLTISGPVLRLRPGDLARFGRMVRAAAGELSAAMGHLAPAHRRPSRDRQTTTRRRAPQRRTRR